MTAPSSPGSISPEPWPQSPDYVILRDAQHRIAAASSLLHTLPEREAKEAASWFEVWTAFGYEEQRDLLLERANLSPRAWELLGVDS